MVIMHYFLGFPPYRSGGLTRYCMDLMETQKNKGDKVIALWPGQISFISKEIHIKKRKNIKNINNYELINPLPVSLDEGIINVKEYTKSCNANVYKSFLRKINPDIIHIHTLMGLHREFLEATKKLKIKTIFTSHDYFGICPKITLYRDGCACVEDHGCRDCIRCNQTALSLRKIQIMQSSLYRNIKDSFLVKKMRKNHRQNFFEEKSDKMPLLNEKEVNYKAREYRKLRNYYVDMLQKMSFIHFNSSTTKNIYEKYMKLPENEVITISHKNIKSDHKNANRKKDNKLRITCLAPARPFKGYNILIEALDKLWSSGNHNFILRMFNAVPDKREYLNINEEGFTQSDLKHIMSDTDILVAPSIWYETFGFTVLEALSFGVPVIVSEHVGAKDIVGKAGIIIKAGNIDDLESTLEKLINSLETLSDLKTEAEKNKIKTWEQFVDENYQLYRKLIK